MSLTKSHYHDEICEGQHKAIEDKEFDLSYDEYIEMIQKKEQSSYKKQILHPTFDKELKTPKNEN